jgi:hypothetical protein
MNKIYSLTSTNLTGLGGMMGTERTDVNYIKYFTTIEFAKKNAEKEYKKKIDWLKEGGKVRSGDLRWVMYDIETVKITK